MDLTIDHIPNFRERMAQVMADRKAAGIVNKVSNPIERAERNPTNKRLAIAAKCWDCQGRDADPHSRWRIGNCTAPDCPLYPHRPSQNLLLLERFTLLAPVKSPGKLARNRS